ncbi:hypothetical protein [Streptomyces sp. MBT53]|uniref:hypothetical protein n=1 Tax=Streptomyces sp. MBT53 TaxID=1488384 RepID=UPI001912F458|nr:hypothetical protein [Streptomyces sp. MBT53]MBK6011709.1 hypothetical protein [Streptomyces sp. MBT53]
MGDQQWTIQSISDALGNPTLAQRFLSEINRAPAHQLLAVFTKWQGTAQRTLDAVQRGREIAAYETRGEEPPGAWIDVTDRVLRDAARNRSQGAA